MVDRCNQEVAIQALVIKAPQGSIIAHHIRSLLSWR